MKCNFCNSIWNSNILTSVCPFCGQNISEAKSPKEMNVSAAIHNLIAENGIDILNDSKYVCAYIMDCVSGYEREKRLIKVIGLNGVLNNLSQISSYKDSSQKSLYIEKQIKILTDMYFFSLENALEAINLVLVGIGEQTIDPKLMPNEKNIPTYTSNSASPKVSGKVGEYITFGTYDDKPIEWLILAKEADKILIISKYGLEERSYHDKPGYITWEKCDLRKWINKDFYESVFSQDEKEIILQSKLKNKDNDYNYKGEIDYSYSGGSNGGNGTTDKVFLLSIDEVKKCLPTDRLRICADTNGEECWWWLRSPADGNTSAVVVGSDGKISYLGFNVEESSNFVRPAVWIRN